MIAETLEARIFDGSLADGARLDEVRLAAEFGVSRTPLREALQRLARYGLVALVPRRGAFVRQPGPVELFEMFEALAEIEAACGGLAALRITDPGLDALRSANAGCREAVARHDHDGYFTEDARFHAVISQHSGNGYLVATAEDLLRRLTPYRRQQLRLRGRMAQSLAEHEAILAALEQGDGPAVAEALRGHAALGRERFHSLMAGLKPAAG